MKKPDGRVVLFVLGGFASFGFLGITGCRATLAGDPDRPIKIEAHITLDVRQVKETAGSIEDMVSGKAAKTAQKPVSRLGEWLVPSVWAEGAQLKFMTPEVERALESRKSRFDTLKSYKGQGFVGEDNQGHAAALGGGPEVQAIVSAENQDRETIYKTIVEQNGLPADSIQVIRSAFGEEQRERASAGEKIQLPSGEWVTK